MSNEPFTQSGCDTTQAGGNLAYRQATGNSQHRAVNIALCLVAGAGEDRERTWPQPCGAMVEALFGTYGAG